MDSDLKNKVVLVTGASRGIGKAIAKLSAEKGANVIIHYNRDTRAAEKVLEELPEGHHMIMQADMSDAKSIEKMVLKVLDELGKIDVLVNNAGIFIEHDIAEIHFDRWEKIWQDTLYTNLIGPAHLCYYTARHMIKNGEGRIINISSRGAFRGEPNAPAYGASKAGMNSMSQSMAQALAPHNIMVFTVAPGFVETDMVSHMLEGPDGEYIRNQSPLKRAATPEEIAGLTVYLASEAPAFLTGSIIDINGASYLRN